MLKQRLKVLIAVLLILAFLVPTYVAFVSSSTGYIRINGKSASVPGQQVQAGGNVSLYFGDVTWSGSQLYLLLSQDAYPQVSAGDLVYTPIFSLSDLTNLATIRTYTTGNGAWIVGNNWINGSIPPTTPVGNYHIKAFDNFATGTAITDTYITVYSVVYSANLQVSPSSGPGGVPAELTGSGYPPSASVTIAYYDPAFGSWNYLSTATANSSGGITFTTEIPDLRKSLGIGDYPETYTPVSYRAEINGIVYSYADYNQYTRGLKKVGNQTASGLYGNGTNLATTVNAKTGDVVALSGKWFHSSSAIYVRWDGQAVVGTVTGDEWRDAVILNTTIADSSGSFETAVTIPTADAGEHYVAVEDSETTVIIKILMSRGALQVSPSSGPGGISVEFTGSGFPASTPVTISYRDPTFGTWNYWNNTTSSPSGTISLSSEMPDLRKSLNNGDWTEASTPVSFRAEISGSVYCYADYNQYSRGLKRVGNQVASGLYGNGTNLATTVSVKTGDVVALSGKWFHSSSAIYVRWDGKAVVGTVTGGEWRNAVIISTSIASSTGSFETAVTIPTADAGEHYVAVEDSETTVIIKIRVESSPTPTPTPTPSPTPTPTPTPTPSPPKATPTIDVSCRGTTTPGGFKAEIYGKLSFNGAAILGEPVLISYSVTGGSSWESLTLVNTGPDGGFLAVWTPSVTGNYLVKAKWEGNSTFNEASTTVNLALTPYSEQNVFSVTSNSTISQFAFDSTSRELSFTASGPSGTTGYVNVYIPKSLINDISELKVYVDGNLITYNSESQTDSWVVSFNYSHSAHKVIIKLSAASSATSGISIEEILIYITIIAVVIAIAAATIVFKRKRQHTKNVHSNKMMPTEQ